MRTLLSCFVAMLLLMGCAVMASACSQCMCGTPFPSGLMGGVVPSQLTYGVEERYLSKSTALDEGPGEEQEREHRVAGFAMWRPVNRLALLGRLPYDFKSITSRPAGDVASTQTSSGLGDAELLALVGLAQGVRHAPLTLGLIVGAAAPTGSSDARDAAGNRLDAHLQPGTGAWSQTGGLNAALAGAAGAWDASVLERSSGSNAHGYRYGDVLLYNVGFTSRTRGGMQWIAQLNGRSADRDRLENGTLGGNTGGSVTYAAPGVRWRSGLGLSAEAAVQIPIAQSLFGAQREHTTARLTLGIDR